jgi:hypothetical protein
LLAGLIRDHIGLAEQIRDGGVNLAEPVNVMTAEVVAIVRRFSANDDEVSQLLADVDGMPGNEARGEAAGAGGNGAAGERPEGAPRVPMGEEDHQENESSQVLISARRAFSHCVIFACF